jgi:hypothetical protein
VKQKGSSKKQKTKAIRATKPVAKPAKNKPMAPLPAALES